MTKNKIIGLSLITLLLFIPFGFSLSILKVSNEVNSCSNFGFLGEVNKTCSSESLTADCASLFGSDNTTCSLYNYHVNQCSFNLISAGTCDGTHFNYCTGSPDYACGSYDGNELGCNEKPACSYNTEDNTCTGDPQCKNNGDINSCNAMSGCVPDTSQCSTLASDQNTCSNYGDCSWNPAVYECQGTINISTQYNIPEECTSVGGTYSSQLNYTMIWNSTLNSLGINMIPDSRYSLVTNTAYIQNITSDSMSVGNFYPNNIFLKNVNITEGKIILKGSMPFANFPQNSPLQVQGATGNTVFYLASGSGLDGNELTQAVIENYYPIGNAQGAYLTFNQRYSGSDITSGNFVAGVTDTTSQAGFMVNRVKGAYSSAYYDPVVFYANGSVFGLPYNTIPLRQPNATVTILKRPDLAGNYQPNLLIKTSSSDNDFALLIQNATGINVTTIDNKGRLVLGYNNAVDHVTLKGNAGTMTLSDGSRIETTRDTLYINFLSAKNLSINNGQLRLTDRGNLSITGNMSIGSGGLANRVVCWKSDAKTLGYCSNAVNATGGCTCN